MRSSRLWLSMLVVLGGCRSCQDMAATPDAAGGPDGGAVPDDGGGMSTDDGPPMGIEVDVPPASFGADGIVVDQPRAGDAVTGQWISVTGWLDPKRWPAAVVSGAPASGFYATVSGHMGIPTVPVRLRSDGRLIAPRVPLVDGKVEIDVVPLPSAAGHAPPQTVRIQVMASDTNVAPVTVTATPAYGAGPLAVTLAARSAQNPNATWEWDFDGDAVSDAATTGDKAASHTFAQPGTYGVTVRARGVGGRWIYGVASVVVTSASEVLDQTTAGSPRAVAVVTDFAAWSAGLTNDGLIAGGDETVLTRAVLVSDGDEVKVYDAHLRPQKTLAGLSAPRGVGGDTQGRFYVADSGHDRVVRFTPDGALDSSFGIGGSIGATVDGVRFRGPTALALGHFGDWASARPQLLVIDAGNDRLVTCGGEPMACSTLVPRVQRDDASDAPAAALAGIAAGGELDDILYTPPGGPFPSVLSDGQRLLGWSRSKGGARFDVVGTPGVALGALAAVPARSLLGMMLVAGADKDGVLREWLVGSQRAPEARRETLPYAVTAIAFDSYATAFRWNNWRRTPGARPRLESGPAVVYVGGAGRLERRSLSSVEALPW